MLPGDGRRMDESNEGDGNRGRPLLEKSRIESRLQLGYQGEVKNQQL